jgi:mxaK protein
MKRAHGHTAFALVAMALTALTVGEGMRLQHAQRINAAVAEWSTAMTSDLRAASSPNLDVAPPENQAVAPRGSQPAGPTPGSKTAPPLWVTAGAADHLPPEARLARAVSLARVDYDAALAVYKSIIQSNRDDLRLIALYDLGNLHLHQAIQFGLADEAQSLPLTELAKQSYRDLLRRDPTDWDARYNLERSLRLAPEEDDTADEDTGPPDPREHERSTIADPRMDLP